VFFEFFGLKGDCRVRIGVFHPTLNMYGGAEFVALVIVNTLAREGRAVELFVNSMVDQRKVELMMGESLASSVRVTVKPSPFAPKGNWEIPEAAYLTFLLKQRNDLVIDTYSNAVFPWVDVTYVHYPFLNVEDYGCRFPYVRKPRLKKLLGLPHAIFSGKLQSFGDKLIIANSDYTAATATRCINADIKVVYPPVPSVFFQDSMGDLSRKLREDTVVTVSRFGLDKGLERIPLIAKMVKSKAAFEVIGLLHDPRAYALVESRIRKLGVGGRVTLQVNAPRNEVKNALKASKLYLHTMMGEHFGISIVEAMAAGCIPIVHNSGGMTEFVPSEYRYETLKEAAEIIDRSLSTWTPDVSLSMRRIAEKFRQENFAQTFSETLKAYLETKN
jgi:alpha-1,2-mannosyltransferase